MTYDGIKASEMRFGRFEKLKLDELLKDTISTALMASFRLSNVSI